MRTENFRCDIFCRVIDNFGDAGICWRLAKAMRANHGWRIRLWIDRPELIPRFELGPLDVFDIEICEWRDASLAAAIAADPPDILIEAFGCSIPEAVLDALELLEGSRLWIDLEYFSAERWVAQFHGLNSPQTGRKLRKFMFIPGFGDACGGILVEPRDATGLTPCEAAVWRERLDLPLADPERLTVTMFAYPQAPFHALLESMITAQIRVDLLLPGVRGIPSDHGTVRVHPLRFLSQNEFDALLRLSDLNFVRGEDSMTRALLAGKPMIWNIYRQLGNAHIGKLEAWLGYLAGTGDPAGNKVRAQLHRGWNSIGAPPDSGAVQALASQVAHSSALARTLRAETGLAERLALFCRDRIKC